MSTPYGNIRLPVSESDSQKVATYNAGLQDMSRMAAGRLAKSVAGSSNVTLTAAESLNRIMTFTGVLTGNISVLLTVTNQEANNPIIVLNSTTGAFTLTIKTTAGGSTGVIVPQGLSIFLWHDGTHVYTSGLSSSSTSARVYNSADLSIANATPIALTFNSERYDTATIHSTSSNTDRLTLPIAGKWRIGATVDWDVNATGYRSILIQKNGTTLLAANTHLAASGVDTNQIISTEDVFAANDYVTLLVSQNSGGSLNVKALGNYSPEFYCSFIGY